MQHGHAEDYPLPILASGLCLQGSLVCIGLMASISEDWIPVPARKLSGCQVCHVLGSIDVSVYNRQHDSPVFICQGLLRGLSMEDRCFEHTSSAWLQFQVARALD